MEKSWWSDYAEAAQEEDIVRVIPKGMAWRVEDLREAAMEAALEIQKTRSLNLGDLVAAKRHPLVCMVTAINGDMISANDGTQDLTFERSELFDPNLALKIGVGLARQIKRDSDSGVKN